jgi:multiple sugar transport system ATP-binding protein
MAELRIVGASKRFGSTIAVDRVSFDVADGEFVVLVGPSGCGKSTMLRMIAGLETVSEGDIFIGPRRVNDVAPRDRDVAMVFQSYALYPFKSVADNISFPLKMRGEDPSEVGAKLGRVSAILGLDELLDRFPRQLSGGQRQRVAMGRAIVRDPSVFLFDEPLSNLDAQLRIVMRGQIKALQRRLKTTMVFVTHDQVEAMTMADRIVVLRDGSIEQIGRPLDLYDRPANPFVARFIGSPSMNLFEGRMDGGLEGRFRGPENIEILLGPLDGAGVGAALTLGVRPEHLDVVPPGTPGSIEADVLVVEPTGLETMIVAQRGETEIVASTRDRPMVDTGDRIALRPDPAQLHVFGPEGHRIESAAHSVA